MTDSVEIHVVMPVGSFGASEYDTELDAALRAIATAASADPESEWADKYGTDFENDEFLMHRYCWCERDDCLWCGADCGCEEDGEIEYFHDGERVTGERQWELGEAIVGKFSHDVAEHGTPEYERESRRFYAAIDERKRRQQTFFPAINHTCEQAGLMISRPRTDRSEIKFWGTPHFWHKSSGFKVRWYKYIGRDTETVGSLPADLLERCLASLEPRP